MRENAKCQDAERRERKYRKCGGLSVCLSQIAEEIHKSGIDGTTRRKTKDSERKKRERESLYIKRVFVSHFLSH